MGCRNALCSFQMHSHKTKVFYFVVIRHCCFWCASYFDTTQTIRISEKAVFVTINHRRTQSNYCADTCSSVRLTINCHLFVCLGSLICRMVAEEGPKPMVITLRYNYNYTTLIKIQIKIQTEIFHELTCQQVGSRGEEQEGGGGSTFIDRGEKPQHLPLSSLAGRPAVCRLLLSTHPPTPHYPDTLLLAERCVEPHSSSLSPPSSLQSPGSVCL